MAYSLDPISANCYPNTTVLINKFDIRDEATLSEVEGTLTAAKSAQWLNAPREDTFDFEHYKAIHRFLFADLYDWAGQVRDVNISKKGTIFCPAEKINEQADKVFLYLKEQNFLRGLAKDPFVDGLVDFYCSTNMLHPFREGNGRTQRVFLSQLAQNAGYMLNFAEIDGDLLMIATIQSAQGVTDLLRSVLDGTIKQINL